MTKRRNLPQRHGGHRDQAVPEIDFSLCTPCSGRSSDRYESAATVACGRVAKRKTPRTSRGVAFYRNDCLRIGMDCQARNITLGHKKLEGSYQGTSSFVPPMETSYQGTNSFVPPPKKKILHPTRVMLSVCAKH